MSDELVEKQEQLRPTSSRYTEDELMARLKFVVGMCLAFTLMGIVFVVLYSIIFVTQPLGAISPVDSKFFELIIPIATFLTGTLSGIMLAGTNKDAQMKALEAATSKPTPSPQPNSSMSSSFGMDYKPSPMSYGGGFGSTMNYPRPEPELGLPPIGAQPISRNGKLGPPQEEHPVI